MGPEMKQVEMVAGRAAATPDPPCTHGLTAGRGDAEKCLECGAATPDPPDAADLVAAHLRERWPCTCRPGMDGGGVYHAADCNSRREGSQAVLAVIRLLRAANPPASPDERLREAMESAWDEGFAAGAAARTAEIVEWLRTTKGDEWMRGQDAARSVVSRFGGGES